MKCKVFSFICLFLICTVFISSTQATVNTIAENKPRDVTILLLGIDSAAGNSDVILLARHSASDHALTFLQLPRDLYCEQEGSSHKLNHMFAACRARGMTEKDALQYTAAKIADVLSVPVDLSICLDISSFSGMVDAVGGIPIVVPFDMTYDDEAQGLHILLPKGPTVLDGRMAEQFVRYRSGYVTGDLGRLDAQKLFFAAALKHILYNLNGSEVVSLALRFGQECTIVGQREDILPAVLSLIRGREELSVRFLSLPGDAIFDEVDKTWYYVANKKSTVEVLSRFFAPSRVLTDATFDAAGRLCRQQKSFTNIYFSPDIPYYVYTGEEVLDINIIKKD